MKNFRLTGTSQMKGRQSTEDAEFFLCKKFVDPFTASYYNRYQSPGFWKTLVAGLQASRLTLFLLVNDAEYIHRSSFLKELVFFIPQTITRLVNSLPSSSRLQTTLLPTHFQGQVGTDSCRTSLQVISQWDQLLKN